VSPGALDHWRRWGFLHAEQRQADAPVWVRLTSDDLARLDGTFAVQGRGQWRLRQARAILGLTEEELWEKARRDELVAYRARIAVSEPTLYPPRYCVQVARDPDHVGPAPPIELPRLASGLFGLPPNHKTVEVHEAQGCHRIPIQPLRVAVGNEAARKGEALGEGPRYTATGYSKTFSFDEAFRNAVAALPSVSRRDAEYARQRIHVDSAGWRRAAASLPPPLRRSRRAWSPTWRSPRRRAAPSLAGPRA